MAERRLLRRRRALRPEVTFSAVAFGAVTASVGVVSATAAPDYPTWDEVQDAKRDEADARAEIDAIETLLTALESSAAEAGREQQIADEQYRLAQVDLEAATAREEELAEASADAEQRALLSKMRAGLIAAHLSRSSAGDLALGLSLEGDSGALLERLTTMGKLTEQSRTIYEAAVADRNLAATLGEQAEAARTAREALATEAQSALAEAGAASVAAQSALGEHQARHGDLLAQLAHLKDTTVEAEAAYRQSLSDAEPPATSTRGGSPAPHAGAGWSGTPAPGSGSPGSGSTGSTSTGSGSTGSASTGSGGSAGSAGATGTTSGTGASGPAAAPAATAPPPSAGGGTSSSAPSASAVSGAVGFARAQIGDSYRLGGYGPNEWDCSGLTKAAYASVGVYIGTHSATNQYNYAAAHGQLVPYADRQAGDLIFYSSGGGDMYHVTLYTGGGMMVEAPYAGVPVREVAVRGSERVAYVARPSA